jgi:uncharacterized protein YcaQ
MLALSWAQVSAFRLHRHHLACRAHRQSLVTVVGDMGGVQAQLMAAAQMSLWARVQDLTPQDVERALWAERTLVKAWCLRGTVHLLPASELPVYAGALQCSALRAEQRWMARSGVGPDETAIMTKAIAEALASGPLTRRQLAERVVNTLGPQARPWVEHSWGGVVKQACLQGLLCFGPNRGQEITFVRRDQWLPDLAGLPVAEAEIALLRRYLHSYGPATLPDFAAWTGMLVQDVLPVRQRLGDEVAEVDIEGKRALLLRQDLPVIQATQDDDQTVRLLPSFDAYLLGHRDKGHLVDEAHYKLVYRKAGWLSPVVLVGGRVAGIWSQARRGRRLRVTVESFEEMPSAVREQIAAEAADLGRFLGATGEVALV